MFSGVNLESSATCNLRCKVCPTGSYPSHIRNGYMSLKTLLAVRNSVELFTEGTDLTGWGEPLMNPYLSAFIESLPNVTFTTNALLLDKRAAQKIVLNQVGAIAISIDSFDEATYKAMHPPGEIATVWKNIEDLRKTRDFNKLTTPILSLHFLMMTRNIGELEKFVKRAAEAGADEVVAKHIAIFSRPGQEQEALFKGYFNKTEPNAKLLGEAIAAATETAGRNNIVFKKVGADNARIVPGCFGSAITRPFVAYDGKVSPCCVLAHDAGRLSPDGDVKPAPAHFFGDVHKSNLEEIWKLEEYIEFREALANGEPPPQCRYCLGAWSVTLG